MRCEESERRRGVSKCTVHEIVEFFSAYLQPVLYCLHILCARRISGRVQKFGQRVCPDQRRAETASQSAIQENLLSIYQLLVEVLSAACVIMNGYGSRLLCAYYHSWSKLTRSHVERLSLLLKRRSVLFRLCRISKIFFLSFSISALVPSLADSLK